MNVEKTGTLIAQRRKELGLTQRELGEALGVSDRAVSKWERGVNLPNADLFEPLCHILKLSIPELLRGERCQEAQLSQEEVAAAAYKLEVLEKEVQAQRGRFRHLVVILVALAAGIAGVWLTVGLVREERAQALANQLWARPSVLLLYRSAIGRIEIEPYIQGAYGPFESDGGINPLSDVPAVQRDVGEMTDWYIKPLELEKGSESISVYIFGEKREMTTQVLRWPQALRGTDAGFEDGTPVEFSPMVNLDSRGEYYGADGGLRFQLEPGYLYSVIFTWGEGYYVEYSFSTQQ